MFYGAFGDSGKIKRFELNPGLISTCVLELLMSQRFMRFTTTTTTKRNVFNTRTHKNNDMKDTRCTY